MSDTLSALLGGPAPKQPKKGKAIVGEEATEIPEKPAWVTDSEKKSGVIYDWDPMLKQWRPKKGVERGAALPIPEEAPPL